MGTTATAGSPVGSYAVTVDVGGLSAANYAVSGANGTLTVGKAPLVVRAEDQARVYGRTNPALTYTVSGFVNGETLATSGVTGSAVVGTTATAGSPAGSYALTVDVSGLRSANYAVNGSGGILTVGQASLVVRADAKSRVYGAANPVLTYAVSGFVNGETLTTSGVIGIPVLSSSATLSSPLGQYPITVAVSGMSAANYSLTAAGGTLTIARWLVATSAAPWDGRAAPAVAVLGGQMWLLGGLATSASGVVSRRSDVWHSPDGTNWTQAVIQAPWSGRNNHGVAVFQNRLWVVGGYDGTSRNDVWSSSDGVSWNQETTAPPWSGRFGIGCVAFQGQLWILGGRDYATGAKSDVWHSADGRNWSLAVINAPWGPRGEFNCVEFGGRLWVYGGELFDAATPTRSVGYANDVWSSTNGIDWFQNTNAVPWSGRTLSAAASTPERLWLLGGARNGAGLREAWWSENGREWYQDSDLVPWSSRYGAAALAFQDRIWLFGGGGLLRTNDVWFASGSRVPPVVSGAGSTNLALASGLINQTYGTALTVSSLGLTNNLPGTYSLVPPGGTVLSAGVRNVLMVFTPDDPSYGAVTGTVAVTVSKGLLSVRADDNSIAVGTANPSLTYTITGFVNGEGIQNLDRAPIPATVASPSSPAGTYPITLSGGVASNYDFSYTPGTLINYQFPSVVLSAPGSTNAVCDTVLLSGVVNGYPPPRLQWFRDGVALSDESRISGVATTQLVMAGLRLGDAGRYSLLVSNSFGTVSSSSFLLSVVNPVPAPSTVVRLVVESLTNAQNSMVSIPIKGFGFTRISGFQFSVHWDPRILEYSGFEATGIPEFVAANIGESLAASGTVTISYDHPNGSSVNLADASSLLSLRMRVVGSRGDSTAIVVDANPTQLEAVDCSRTVIPVTGSTGTFFVASTQISGAVLYYQTGLPVAGASVFLSGSAFQTNVTDAAGRYRFVVDPGSNYVISVVRSSEFPANQGVTTADILMVRRHILGKQRLSSAFQTLAADVDGSGAVSTADISNLRKVVLGLTNAFPGGLWKFVPTSLVLTNPLVWPTQSVSRSVSNILVNTTNQDFVAIKLGDVDGSWVSASGNNPGPASLSRRLAAEDSAVTLVTDLVAGSVGDTVSVKVNICGCTNVSSLQFSLGWNTNLLGFLQLGEFGLPGLSAGNFGPASPGDNGQLAVSWDDPSGGDGVAFPDGSVIFSIQFRILAPGGLSIISFADNPASPEVVKDSRIALFNGLAGGVVPRSATTAAVGPPLLKVGASSTLSLDAIINGGSLGSIQWRRNGVPIPGATDSQLRLQNVSRTANGLYSLIATDVDGVPVISSETAVTVVAPPYLRLLVQPTDSVLRLEFGDLDGGAITPDRVSGFVVQAKTNLAASEWVTINSSLELTNGLIWFGVTNSVDNSGRFYRVIER